MIGETHGEMVESSDIPTLYRILAPYRIEESQFFETYRGPMFIVKRLLGMYVQTCSTVCIFPPALDVINMAAPLFNNAPQCDLGFGPMSVRLRRLIQTSTAMTAECTYCTAHNCGIGDVFHGAAMFQALSPEEMSFLPKDLNASERDALRLVVASVKVPARVTREIRDAAVRTYGTDGLEICSRPMALIGYLSVLMETLGAELEPAAAEHARRALKEGRDWEVNSWALPKQSSHAPSVWNDPKAADPFATATNYFGKNSVTSFMDLAYHIYLAERSAPKSAVPKTEKELDQWFMENMGFIPRFLKRMPVAVRHVYTHSIWHLILMDPSDAIDDRERTTIASRHKVTSGYVYFVSTQNGLLARHWAAVAAKRGIPAGELNDAVYTAKSASPTSPRDLVSHLYRMAWCEARRERTTLQRLCAELLELTSTARGCMEVVSLLAMCAMLQRVSAFLDDFTGTEPEVAGRLQEGGYLTSLEDLRELGDVASVPEIVSVIETKEERPWGGHVFY
ncbi:hypothetical protein M427DRAFT_181152 [Gonapodya prolifera JEL478]|uniref:Uncharacterized protein n=1 Tax=Gonapodya prolifera (strain JEL478) TaxID=1344416 RepID=A0A139AQJ5_GONPJ|nr:hypothetical protein M427DRAFT_181152 [Gonapodya prolifera JEL478]|eukprot:KXS19009.1 hypothetical protein M427DRAFT_181152 [Gonapodya prolifera JEL478]